MCRLLVFRSRTRRAACLLDDLLMRPAHSIIKQSHSSAERTVAGEVPAELNADGFGVAWYYLAEDDATGGAAAATPALFRSVTPAWSSASLRSICGKVRSGCVFAHVRAASPGSPVTEANTHPFVRDRWTFMHNGCVGCWGGAVRRRIVARLSDEALDGVTGSSDSEFCFALFLTELGRVQPITAPAPADVVQGCLLRTVFALEMVLKDAGVDHDANPSLLNFAVTDGRTVSATRHVLGRAPAPSLYMATGSKWAPVEGAPEGAYRMQSADRSRQCAVLASERLTFSVAGSAEDGDASAARDAAEWVQVPPSTAVTIGPELNILLVPVPSALKDPEEAAAACAVRTSAGWRTMRDLGGDDEVTPGPGAAAAASIDDAPSGEPAEEEDGDEDGELLGDSGTPIPRRRLEIRDVPSP